jgi:hypothetical protein
MLYYLNTVHSISSLNIICLRAGSASRRGRVSVPAARTSSERPASVGWERNKAGKLGSRMADLGPMMDPARYVCPGHTRLTCRLADQAVDLNLKLMRWRIMPSLDLEKISSTKCLLLGAGTLGCYVSRALMVRRQTHYRADESGLGNPKHHFCRFCQGLVFEPGPPAVVRFRGLPEWRKAESSMCGR